MVVVASPIGCHKFMICQTDIQVILSSLCNEKYYIGENLFHQKFNIESIAGLGDSFIHAVKDFSYIRNFFYIQKESSVQNTYRITSNLTDTRK